MGYVKQTSPVFLICQSNDDVHLLLIDVTCTRNDSIYTNPKSQRNSGLFSQLHSSCSQFCRNTSSNKILGYPSITWNFNFYHKSLIVTNKSILKRQCVCCKTKRMGLCRYSACDMHWYTRKRRFINFKRLKFMGHPNVSEQKCVICCMLG